MGRGRERSKVESGNVIASGDPPIKKETAILIGGMKKAAKGSRVGEVSLDLV